MKKHKEIIYKTLILIENLNKTQEIRLAQYSMDEIFNRLKKI